jgi:hypothetical protein
VEQPGLKLEVGEVECCMAVLVFGFLVRSDQITFGHSAPVAGMLQALARSKSLIYSESDYLK